MQKINKIVLLICAFVSITLAQNPIKLRTSDPSLYTIGYMTGNRVGISFYNDGAISGFNQGVDIRGEWPLGSGYNYIGDLTPLIGVEAFANDSAKTKFHSVSISRGPRKGQYDEKDPKTGLFWGFNPVPGFRNPQYQSVAISDEPKSWPVEGWADQPTWKDEKGNTQWNGYFGRGVINADLETYYVADDHWDREFNKTYSFYPNALSGDTSRMGMGLQMFVRGFQWNNILAQDVIFWLYKIKNDGVNPFRKAAFGTVVGTLAGGDGDSQDDLGFFDPQDWITYSWDADNKGNKGQKVGYVGYAYLESPGNAYNGIDDDDDCPSPDIERFTAADFDTTKVFNVGDEVILIDSLYNRTKATVQLGTNYFKTCGTTVVVEAGVTLRREGWIIGYIWPGQKGLKPNPIQGAVAVMHESAYDGIDNDLDGLIDENESLHFRSRIEYKNNDGSLNPKPALKRIDYFKLLSTNNYNTHWHPLVDEKRDNDAGNKITTYVKTKDVVELKTFWSGDEDGDWNPETDDVGSDGIGPLDDGYTGPDPDGSEGNGKPDQGEPNFGKTDSDESDQIGLTGFNFFALADGPDMSQDEDLWQRMEPGRFDVIPAKPQDGDFIYSSGYFPLLPDKEETFSVALLFGDDYDAVIRMKRSMQTIYNNGYTFAKPPRAPRVNITQEDGKVTLYWDPAISENTIDVMTKEKDFQGFKIYRATDNDFRDARVITNAFGSLVDDKPIAQYDLDDSIQGFFYATKEMLDIIGGYSFYLGKNTGITNKFVDSSVTPGLTYYYAVCAYDRGDASKSIFPSINSKTIMVTPTGEILTKGGNTAYIRPGRNVAGFQRASVQINKKDGFLGTGKVFVDIIDNKAITETKQYKMTFVDTGASRKTAYWSLISENDTLFKNSDLFNEPTKIFNGISVAVLPDIIAIDTSKTKFIGVSDTIKQSIYVFNVPKNPKYNGLAVPYDYEIEFLPNATEMSVPDTIGNTKITAQSTNIRVKNLTLGGTPVKYVYNVNKGATSVIYSLWFKEYSNNKYTRTWRVDLRYENPNKQLPTSGKLLINTSKPFLSTDELTFTITPPSVDNAKAKSDLDKIKVVPNPYVVTHEGEPKLSSFVTSGRGERVIRFTHVPYKSTIRIYTVRGELVKTLYQDDLYNGDVKWNLRTEENLDVAFGVYIYVVETDGIGTKTGKFALIK